VGPLARLVGDDVDVLTDPRFKVVVLGSVVAPMGASVVSPLLDTLAGVYGVSGARVGLVMAAFTAPGIVAIPLVGALSDRVGRKPVLTAGLTTFGVTGVALAVTTDFRTTIALRLLQGLGYTGIAPVLIAITGDLFDGDREATAQGLRFTTVGLSIALFPFLAGLLVALAWQFPLLLFALALPVAAVVHLRFEELPAGDDDPGVDLSRLARLVATPRVGLVVAGRAVPSFLWFVFLTYNSIVVVRLLGHGAGTAGALVALASVTSSAASTQVGRLTAAFGTRRIPLFVTTVAAGVGLVALSLAPSLPVAVGSVVVVGAGFGVSISLYRSTVSTLAPDHLRGSLVSLAESVGRIGSTVAPVLIGGVITVATPRYGFAVAVRGAIAVVVTVVVILGAASVLVATRDADAAD
jgi:MFS family permease